MFAGRVSGGKPPPPQDHLCHGPDHGEVGSGFTKEPRRGSLPRAGCLARRWGRVSAGGSVEREGETKGKVPVPTPTHSPQRGPSPQGPARATEGRWGPSAQDRLLVLGYPGRLAANILGWQRDWGASLSPPPSAACSSPPKGWGGKGRPVGRRPGLSAARAFSIARPTGLPSSPQLPPPSPTSAAAALPRRCLLSCPACSAFQPSLVKDCV